MVFFRYFSWFWAMILHNSGVQVRTEMLGTAFVRLNREAESCSKKRFTILPLASLRATSRSRFD